MPITLELRRLKQASLGHLETIYLNKDFLKNQCDKVWVNKFSVFAYLLVFSFFFFFVVVCVCFNFYRHHFRELRKEPGSYGAYLLWVQVPSGCNWASLGCSGGRLPAEGASGPARK